WTCSEKIGTTSSNIRVCVCVRVRVYIHMHCFFLSDGSKDWRPELTKNDFPFCCVCLFVCLCLPNMSTFIRAIIWPCLHEHQRQQHQGRAAERKKELPSLFWGYRVAQCLAHPRGPGFGLGVGE